MAHLLCLNSSTRFFCLVSIGDHLSILQIHLSGSGRSRWKLDCKLWKLIFDCLQRVWLFGRLWGGQGPGRGRRPPWSAPSYSYFSSVLGRWIARGGICKGWILSLLLLLPLLQEIQQLFAGDPTAAQLTKVSANSQASWPPGNNPHLSLWMHVKRNWIMGL